MLADGMTSLKLQSVIAGFLIADFLVTDTSDEKDDDSSSCCHDPRA